MKKLFAALLLILILAVFYGTRYALALIAGYIIHWVFGLLDFDAFFGRPVPFVALAATVLYSMYSIKPDFGKIDKVINSLPNRKK